MEILSVKGLTDTGLIRKINEDQFLICKSEDKGTLAAVIDATGGKPGGPEAAKLVAASFRWAFESLKTLPENDNEARDWLKKTILQAGSDLVLHNTEKQRPSGAAVLVALINKDKIHAAWSGDCRMYLYRQGYDLELLTDDHSVVWEGVQAGEMSREQARLHPESHILRQCLGDDQYPADPEALTAGLRPGDRIVLCSDGIWSMLSHETLHGILKQNPESDKCLSALTEAAKYAGGHDNISLILADAPGGKKAETPRPDEAPFAVKDNENTAGRQETVVTGIIVMAVLFIFISGFVFSSYLSNVSEKDEELAEQLSEDTDENTSAEERFRPEPILSSGDKPAKENAPKPADSIAKPIENQPLVTNDLLPPSEAEIEKMRQKLIGVLDKKEGCRRKLETYRAKSLSEAGKKQFAAIDTDFKGLWAKLKPVADPQSRLIVPADRAGFLAAEKTLIETEAVLNRINTVLTGLR